MKAYPLLFTPTYHERIWGGRRLKDFFEYPIPSQNTGEAWVISDHPNGRSLIANGAYQGKTIQELLREHPDWFAPYSMKRFPILVKLLDAQDDLSVQVHPNDEFAAIHENGEMGKSEFWYIVHAEPGAEIVYGHTAASGDELASQITSGRWADLLVRVPVRTGDFFYIPNGTIHALGKGIVVLETQQSSDATYRAYDYDRTDASGRKRELHIDKVLQVTQVPFVTPTLTARVEEYDALQATRYLQGPYFSVEKWNVRGTHAGKTKDNFILLSVLAGTGRLIWRDGEISLQKGDHLLLPRTLGRYQLCGEWEAIASTLLPPK